MKLTRRQFVVSAVATGAAAASAAFVMTDDTKPAFVWRSKALGGEAKVSLYNADRDTSESALAEVLKEIRRLEALFSLHIANSEISRLNASGMLIGASVDLKSLLSTALEWRKQTAGAFDPTVQPLWQAASDGIAVSPEALAKAGTPIELHNETITLAPGAAITLNGIAQGRIADRVASVLMSHGFSDLVVDTGELRLLGNNRRAVGIPAVKAAVSVAGMAISTSEPKSKIFDARTFRHHLIDPRTGASPRYWESISVFAPTAEMADALSTAFAIMPLEAVDDAVQRIANIAIIGADGKGRVRRFGDTRIFTGGLPT